MNKPIIRKPTEKTSPAIQPIDLAANKKDNAVLEKVGDSWYAAIYSHPVVKARFSYQLTIDRRVRLNPSPIEDGQADLFGCFGTPQEALEAAMEEVEVN